MTDEPGTITERQRDYIIALLDERNLFASPRFFDAVNAMDEGEYNAYLEHMKHVAVPKLSKRRASALIETLKALPKKVEQKQTTRASWEVVDVNTFAQMGQRSEPGEELYCMFKPDHSGAGMTVPRGSYAVKTNSIKSDRSYINEVNFYSVWIADQPDDNGDIRWSVKQYVSDELTKLPRREQYVVLDAIGYDPYAAATLYGLEKKRCGICHRKLTKDESRERGIGPICAERYGW